VVDILAGDRLDQVLGIGPMNGARLRILKTQEINQSTIKTRNI